MKLLFLHSSLVTKSTVVFAGAVSTELKAATTTTHLTPTDSIFPMLTGLVVILFIIFGLAYIFKRFSNFSVSSRSIKVLETQSLGHKEKIIIVQVRDQQFLLGVTGQSINQLGELKVDTVRQPEINQNTSAIKDQEGRTKKSTFSNIMDVLLQPRSTNTSRDKFSSKTKKPEPL